VSVVCCQVEVSARVCSLVQRSPTECRVSECDREASTVRPRPTRAVDPLEEEEERELMNYNSVLSTRLHKDKPHDL
jgi:hypothetical protein